MQPFFERYPLRFSCTQCGKCCMTGGDYHVFLTASEAEKIRDYLQLSHGWFRRRYLQRLDDGDLVLASGKGDRCIFLNAGGTVASIRCVRYSAGPIRFGPNWQVMPGPGSARRVDARVLTRGGWCQWPPYAGKSGPALSRKADCLLQAVAG